LQPREIASATVVPPQEQDTGFAGRRTDIDQLPRKISPQTVNRMGMVFERKAKKRLRGRRLVFWTC
jgi:hypothetical protein